MIKISMISMYVYVLVPISSKYLYFSDETIFTRDAIVNFNFHIYEYLKIC
jgi:hypothetical protein